MASLFNKFYFMKLFPKFIHIRTKMCQLMFNVQMFIIKLNETINATQTHWFVPFQIFSFFEHTITTFALIKFQNFFFFFHCYLLRNIQNLKLAFII